MQISDPQRLRITLALVALRYRPKDQSVAAYVLDLCGRFPLVEDSENERDGVWRERALALEEEVNTLKRKFDGDLAELELLRATTAAAANEDATLGTPQSSITRKKKKKLNVDADCSKANVSTSMSTMHLRTDVQRALRGFDAGTNPPELLGSLLLFSSYQKLLHFSAAKASQPTPPILLNSLLSSATIVLRTLGIVLRTVIHPQQKLKNPLDALRGIDTIVRSTLSCIIPILSSTKKNKLSRPSAQRHDFLSLLDLFFGALALDLVNPLVKSFSQVSQDIISNSFHEARLQKKKGHLEAIADDLRFRPDIRPGLLSIFRGITSILRGSDGDTFLRSGQFLEVVTLSAVTEISRVCNPAVKSLSLVIGAETNNASLLNPSTKLSRQERLYRLARKDAMWYLCAIVHDALSAACTQPDAWKTQTVPTVDAIQEKLNRTLSSLLVHCTAAVYSSFELGALNIDEMCEVEKGMVMGIIERVWLGDLFQNAL